jgi:hypothetical protein
MASPRQPACRWHAFIKINAEYLRLTSNSIRLSAEFAVAILVRVPRSIPASHAALMI